MRKIDWPLFLIIEGYGYFCLIVGIIAGWQMR
jgi:hypothetical protein